MTLISFRQTICSLRNSFTTGKARCNGVKYLREKNRSGRALQGSGKNYDHETIVNTSFQSFFDKNWLL